MEPCGSTQPGRRVALALVLLIATAVSVSRAGETTPTVELEALLANLARAAEEHLARSLGFTADETTRLRSYAGNSKRPSRYTAPVAIYLYLRTPDGRLTDRRIKRSDRKRLERILQDPEHAGPSLDDLPDPLDDLRVVEHVVRPYSWIQLFSGSVQPFYRYRIEELTTYDSRPAVRVSFEPSRDPLPEDWYGTAVVDLQSFGLLHAEGLQSGDRAVRQRVTELLESPEELPLAVAQRTFVVKEVSTEFGLEREGLRFPTEVATRIHSYIVRGPADDKRVRTRLSAEIIQTYDNYRIYEVRTQERLRSAP